MSGFDFKTYISPFTWRYSTSKMRHIYSEEHKYELWRKIWVAVASAEQSLGLVSKEELEDLKNHQNNVSIERILEIEKETKHDVVAAIREYAEKATVGGGKLHLGLTSMDIVDNADTIRTKEALELVEKDVKEILSSFSEKIEQYADTTCLGYTHLQPAEPTTVGYRFAFYAQDLLIDFQTLEFVKTQVKGKGIKGAVGTQASFMALLQKEEGIKNKELRIREMEEEIMENLGLEAVEVSSQVAPRKIDYLVLSLLASIAQSLAKFAADLRILQSPMIGEWSEPFSEKQVGSSAMPFKKNPINAEKICSLARVIATVPQVALENAELSYLERTLDDSANRRITIAESFLALSEILETTKKILTGMVINEKRIAHNLSQYAPFIASEKILMEAVNQGASRQDMHEVLREAAMKSWQAVAEGKENPMKLLLGESEAIKKYVSKEKIDNAMDVTTHVGTAYERAKKIAEKIKEVKD